MEDIVLWGGQFGCALEDPRQTARRQVVAEPNRFIHAIALKARAFPVLM